MEKVPKKPSHLIKRGNAYSIRLRIPNDLREAYASKTHIQRSLGTSDIKQAKELLTLAKLKIDAEFDQKRRKAQNKNSKALKDTSSEDLLSRLDHHKITTLVLDWFHDQKNDNQKRRNSDLRLISQNEALDMERELRDEEYLARMEVWGIDVPETDEHKGYTIASRVLKEKGIGFDRKSPAFQEVSHLFSKAIHELASQVLDEWERKPHSPDPMFSNVTRQKTIREVIDEFLSNPGDDKSISTVKNYIVIKRLLDQEVGLDTPITQLDRDQCKKLRDLAVRLPSNATKRAPDVTLREAAALAEKHSWPLVAAGTVNSYMQKLSAVLEFARKERYVFSNEAEGLNVKEKTKAKDRRHPFSPENLNAIFQAPLYTGCVDDDTQYKEPGPNKPRNARFWVPLISLWTGMRLNEICQLHISDIAILDGVPVIHIRTDDASENEDDNEKRVKTENGIRFVPIHPMLQKIGFLDFVEERRKSGQIRLFHELQKDRFEGFSAHLGRWFSRFLKEYIPKTNKTVFHSFRHNYRDALREANVIRAAELQLGGWAPDKTDEIYGKGLRPKTLYEEIKKISYPELDLSHLIVKADVV